MHLAPVALFVYNRPKHTLRTLEALSKNYLSDQSELYIFSDGSKIDCDQDQLAKIKEVREIIASKKWCKTVNIIESDTNNGLASSIIIGINKVLLTSDRIIVLEDDLVCSKGFLKYMNDALTIYESDRNVMHIAGYQHPFIKLRSSTFFSNTMNCSGWGTWRRAWVQFIPDIENISKRILNKNVLIIDPLVYRICEQIRANKNGTNSTWAVKWYCTIILNNGLCLNPNISLIRNIGFDYSGSNPLMDLSLVYQKTSERIIVKRIAPRQKKCLIIYILFLKFFSSSFRIKKEMIKKMLFPRCEFYL